MTDLDTLRPEVREAVNDIDSRLRDDYWWAIIRAELRRLENEIFGMHLALSEHDALCEQSTTYRLRAERAEGDCNDLRKRLNDAISERNTIRRERAQEHSKHAREGAELAALKARIAGGWLCGVSNDKCRGNFDAAIYCLPSRFRGKRVRLVVEE